VVGYAMRKMDFPVAPGILALVLGPLMEVNLRRALSLSNGDPGVLLGSPLAIGLWMMVALSLALPFVTRRTPMAAITAVEEEHDDNTTQQD
jgi:putative tricarboxylic transport membrane protein